MLKTNRTLSGTLAEFWCALEPSDAARLDALEARLEKAKGRLIGYPANQVFDYAELFRFLQFAGNNIGDPFARSASRLDTHDFECEVIRDFAELLHGDPGATWGYVTNGGTEGNIYGLYLARETFPQGVVYYSEDSHYSVAKIVRLLGARSAMIKSQPSGEMDYDDLAATLRIRGTAPPIVAANIGTTMKGAVDDVTTIVGILDNAGIRERYIHCDAALSGMLLPFIDAAPPFDFAAGVDSIAISGHKMIGAPLPCGVVLSRKRHVDRIARSVEYVGTLDTTISGSRSALAPLMLWYAWRRVGHDGFRRLVRRCLELADYAIAVFDRHGVRAWRNEHSITVVIPRPADAVLDRWQLAPQRDIAHLVTLPHVTEAMIDEFVADYIANLAIPTEAIDTGGA